jgi:hypothetical protein
VRKKSANVYSPFTGEIYAKREREREAVKEESKKEL